MDRARQLLEEVEELFERGDFEVVDVVTTGSARGLTVRVFVDKPGGVSLDDCARVSRAIGDHIDARGLVNGPYVLEVSSPGVDRPLKRARDFERFRGETVQMTTYEEIEGRHRHTGILRGYDRDRNAVLLTDSSGDSLVIPLGAIKKANLKRDPWARRAEEKHAEQ